MFDQFESFHKPVRSVWVRAAIAISVIAHVGFAAALVVNAAWRVGKLQIEDTPMEIAAFGLPAAPPPALSGAKKERKKIPITKTKDLTQKSDVTENRDVSEATGEGDPNGDADGVGNSQGDTPGATNTVCPIGGCFGGTLDIPPPEVTKKPEPVKNVDYNMIKGSRTGGDAQIHPSNATRAVLARSGITRVHGIVHACIGTSGRIVSSRVLKSTGQKAYDAKLLAGVRRWTYRPYQLGGKKLQVCTAIHFIYRVTQ